jgi:hypothetical protein
MHEMAGVHHLVENFIHVEMHCSRQRVAQQGRKHATPVELAF